MISSKQDMGFPTVENFTAIEDKFKFSTSEKIPFLICTQVVFFSGILVHSKLLSFLPKQDTYINELVIFQLKSNIVHIPFLICLGTILSWFDWPNPIICYTYSFMTNFVAISIQSHSFFVAIFRYLCIVKTDKIWKTLGSNAPKVYFTQFQRAFLGRFAHIRRLLPQRSWCKRQC